MNFYLGVVSPEASTQEPTRVKQALKMLSQVEKSLSFDELSDAKTAPKSLVSIKPHHFALFPAGQIQVSLAPPPRPSYFI